MTKTYAQLQKQIVKLQQEADAIKAKEVAGPDGHFKFPHLWPVKLPRAGRPNYESASALSAMREVASLSR